MWAMSRTGPGATGGGAADADDGPDRPPPPPPPPPPPRRERPPFLCAPPLRVLPGAMVAWKPRWSAEARRFGGLQAEIDKPARFGVDCNSGGSDCGGMRAARLSRGAKR